MNGKRGVGRPKKPMDSESRFRREIANERERQRVDSINDGIRQLRQLLSACDHQSAGICKSAVLIRSSYLVAKLDTQLKQVLDQNLQLKHMVCVWREYGSHQCHERAHE